MTILVPFGWYAAPQSPWFLHLHKEEVKKENDALKTIDTTPRPASWPTASEKILMIMLNTSIQDTVRPTQS